jgi:4-oxalmesaconate hydratase
VGAVKGVDPESGFNYDDTRRYIDASATLTPDQKRAIFAGNARRVYSRIPAEVFA